MRSIAVGGFYKTLCRTVFRYRAARLIECVLVLWGIAIYKRDIYILNSNYYAALCSPKNVIYMQMTTFIYTSNRTEVDGFCF